MTLLSISAPTTSSTSSSLSEHDDTKTKSPTSLVAEPLFSKFNHTHQRRRRRRKVTDESASITPQPQTKLD